MIAESGWVAVVGSRRWVEVSLDGPVPAAELVAELVPLLEPADGRLPQSWGLVGPDGRRLDPGRSLAAQGVGGGAVLQLERLTSPAPAAPIDDVVDAVAAAVDREEGRWFHRLWQRTLVAAAAALLAGAGTAAAVDAVVARGDRSTAVGLSLLGAGVLLSSGAALAARGLREPGIGALLGLATLALWVAGAVDLALTAGLAPPAAAAAGLVAACAGALLPAALASEAMLAPAAGVVSAAAVPAVAAGVAAAAGGGLAQAASAVVVLALAALRFAPGVGGVPVLERLAARGDARVLTAAVPAGVAAALGTSAALVALAGGWFGRGLAAAALAAVLARGTRGRSAAVAVPPVAAVLVGLVALGLGLTRALLPGGIGAVAPPLLLAAVVLLVAGELAGRRALPSWVVRHAGKVEAAALVVSLLLAVGVMAGAGAG